MQPLNHWHDRQSLAGPNYLSKLPQVELEITRGRVRNRLRPMRGTTFLIGSGKHCDLVLGDSRFAEVHGYLLLSAQGLVLRDLGFEPELTVDGRPARNIVLWNQARIRTGPFEFRVHIKAAAEREAGRQGWDAMHGAPLEGREGKGEAPLRVYRGDERLASLQAAEASGNRSRRRPPTWRHLSHLILQM